MRKNERNRLAAACAAVALLLCVILAGCTAEVSQARSALPAPDKTQAFETLRWPNNELTALLPQPESTRGAVAWNDSDGIGIYVADVDQAAFTRYAEACWQNGFTVQYHLDDSGFEAANIRGYRLLLDYDSAESIMLIRMEAPEAAVDANDSAAAVETAAAALDVTAAPETTQETETEQSKEDTTSPETAASSEETAPSEETTTYILNKNTKKFHLPDCSSVADIKEQNRAEFNGSREDLIAQGYEPCKRCKP